MLKSNVLEKPDQPCEFLATIAGRVRHHRKQQKWSQRQLAEKSGISLRYLAQVEAGQGNVSISVLAQIAASLKLDICAFLLPLEETDQDISATIELLRRANIADREHIRQYLEASCTPRPVAAGRVALVGMRGAGKTALGTRAAALLHTKFIGLTDLIEESSGLAMSELFNFFGSEGYRRYEADAVRNLSRQAGPMIVEFGGGIVENAESYGMVLESFHTIWLSAEPDEHMNRVRAQGDLRPMAGNSAAMLQLRNLLQQRETGYRRAGHHFHTSNMDAGTAAERLAGVIEPLLKTA